MVQKVRKSPRLNCSKPQLRPGWRNTGFTGNPFPAKASRLWRLAEVPGRVQNFARPPMLAYRGWRTETTDGPMAVRDDGRRETGKGGLWCLLFLFSGLFLFPGLFLLPGLSPARAETLTPLVIETAGGSHRFQVEVAATPDERERGLMFRETLKPGHGMLFDYGAPTKIVMWMKNTLIPLDMIFVNAGSRVVNVYSDAVPGSLRPIRSAARARAVVEVAGGTVERLGVKAGDRVRHGIFGDSVAPHQGQ